MGLQRLQVCLAQILLEADVFTLTGQASDQFGQGYAAAMVILVGSVAGRTGSCFPVPARCEAEWSCRIGIPRLATIAGNITAPASWGRRTYLSCGAIRSRAIRFANPRAAISGMPC